MQSFRRLIETLGEKYPPRMTYDGDGSRDSFVAWQRRFRAKMDELRGEPLPRPEPRTRLLDRRELDDHFRERIEIDSVLGAKVAAYVLLPKGGGQAPKPGVLALHGHGPYGKESIAGVKESERGAYPSDYGRAAVRAGFVVLCPDWWGWGDREEEDFDFGQRDMCNTKFVAAAMYGVPLLSLMLSDGQAALDVLCGRPEVESSRIGVIGNSYGGRMSMYMTAFDDRIRCAVCAGCLNCFRERSLKLSSCGAQFFPGMLQWGDVQEAFALIAPRALMLIAGTEDTLLPDEWVGRMLPTIRRAYSILDADDSITLLRHRGGHYIPRDEAVSWLVGRLSTP